MNSNVAANPCRCCEWSDLNSMYIEFDGEITCKPSNDVIIDQHKPYSADVQGFSGLLVNTDHVLLIP